MTFVVTTR